MNKNVNISINPNQKLSHINKEIYGHFSEHLGRCIYNGLYVGEGSNIPNTDGVRNDVITALKEISIPVLRWPGGCFADEYHWKDGIGKKANRKRMINTNWGGTVEDNSFGTHEFMNLCEELGCEPYLAGNLGSGTTQELSEWVEYITFDGESPMANLRRENGRDKPWRFKFLGIGNENWGCGGSMQPEYYANEYRKFQTFCKNFSGNELFKVACGPNSNDYNWTETLLKNMNNNHTKALSLHYYTVPTGDWQKKGDAVEFSDKEYYQTISSTSYMDELIQKHSEILHKYDESGEIKLIIDEWGCWYDVEKGTNPAFLYQQNTMRDAIISAINLNIFNNHSDMVIMANLAQVVNVLQAVILTDGENIVLTPTYYVFKMFKNHQNSTLISSEIRADTISYNDVDISPISQSASVDENGNLLITLSNCSLTDSFDLDINISDFIPNKIEVELLNAEAHSYNDFMADENVNIKPFNDYKFEDGKLTFTAMPTSVFAVKLFK